MKRVIMGNHSVSYAVMLSRVEVIAAYPITPQTQIVEMLSELCANNKLNAKFIKVESEHSAMACCIGASVSGARTFTATSSQGLLLMHELLHWASGGRLPIVMANVNRAIAPGWNIWMDQTDSLSQRDTGWLQFYCGSNQELLDSIIISYRMSEIVMLPTMVVYDAFYISHTSEPVDIPSQELVDIFLPRYEPSFKLDIDNPYTFYGLTGPEHYLEMRYEIEKGMDKARGVIKDINEEFKNIIGRGYESIEEYKTEDADTILVTSGSISSTSRIVIDEFQKNGKRVGLLRIRMFRPFPYMEIRNILEGRKKVAIVDRNISFGSGGIFAQEIKGAISNMRNRPVVFSFIGGLGGRDIRTKDIEWIINYTMDMDEPAEDIIWFGLKI